MNNLNALRNQARLRAEDLAESLGVARSTIYAWEDGTRELRPAKAKLVLAALAKHGVYATLDVLYAAPERAA